MTNSLGTLVSAATPATLAVGPVALVSIAVTPTGASIASGTTEAFTATGTYSDGSTQILTSSVTWSATTLSGGGAVTFTGNSSANVAKATAAGEVTITATSGSISGSTPLIVTAPALVSIVVTSTAPAVPPAAGTPAVITIYQGQTQQFYALGTFSDSSIQNITETVAWSAGTGSVATVGTSGTTAGLATAVAAGTVPIVATSASITGSGTLTVTGLTSVTLTPAGPTVGMGDANTANPPSETSQQHSAVHGHGQLRGQYYNGRDGFGHLDCDGVNSQRSGGGDHRWRYGPGHSASRGHDHDHGDLRWRIR
jgi:trimeric autotransporter adhesin